MAMHNEALVYSIADSLQQSLQAIGMGFKAKSLHKTKVADWLFDLELTSKSDANNLSESSVFTRVRKNLWLYTVALSSKSAESPDGLYCYVFDASLLKMVSGYLTTPCGVGKLDNTVAVVKKHAAALYEFETKTNTWKSIPVATDIL